ncbi:hypothetical protein BGW39_010694 [Mortierella sp. 14UC]|nr:hypothetical protein BGW39_010694 [Mortierella sp. 14UC]
MPKSAFWNVVRKALTVNPKTSTGMPDPRIYRQPSPSGRPKPMIPDDPWANDIAENPYYGRDLRRNYPRLAVYSQEEVAGLIAAKEGIQIESGKASLVKTGDGEDKVELTEILKNAKKELYSPSNLPPTPGIRKVLLASSQRED